MIAAFSFLSTAIFKACRKAQGGGRKCADKAISHFFIKNYLTIVPYMGTIVPYMGTIHRTRNWYNMKNNDISNSLFGKNRKALLSLLFSHSDESYYFRQIKRAIGIGQGALQRELKQLTESGIITRRRQGRQIHYQTNPDCPIFAELKNLIIKTAGVAEILRAGLLPLAEHIQLAFIYGSFAKGDEKHTSDVDLMVIGNVTFSGIVSALGPAQETLRREVNPTVYPLNEFITKVTEKDHFILRILDSVKIFIIGDEHGFTGLVKHWVVN